MELLKSILDKKGQYGEAIQPSCPADALARLSATARRELAFEIPEAYSAFLSITDGLVWNGLCIFASHRSLIAGFTDRWVDGFIERNVEERGFDDRMNEYMVFAEDGEVSFALNIPTGRYEIVSRVARYVDESFDSFDELLAAAMRNHC